MTIKNFQYHLLLQGIILLVVMTGKVQAVSIELPLQQVNINYSSPVRLDQVLTEVNKHIDLPIYELGSQLFVKRESNETKKLLDKTMKELAQLAKMHPDSGASSVHWQLRESMFGQRVFIPLELDEVQTQDRMNPLLNESYQLYVTARPNSITLVGLVNNTKQLTFKAHATLDDYLELTRYSVLPNANPNVAYVIQPDGQVNEVPYGYWNYEPRYFAPGAVVFIAFDSLPKQYLHLNEAVIELLRHKVNK